MSKNIKEYRCVHCDSLVFRKEEGEIRNANGTYGTNLQVYFVNRDYCPHCCEKKEADREKSKVAY